MDINKIAEAIEIFVKFAAEPKDDSEEVKRIYEKDMPAIERLKMYIREAEDWVKIGYLLGETQMEDGDFESSAWFDIIGAFKYFHDKELANFKVPQEHWAEVVQGYAKAKNYSKEDLELVVKQTNEYIKKHK